MVPLTFVWVVITDISDGFSHHLLVVHVGSGRDLATKQHHASLTHRLCFNTQKKKLYFIFVLITVSFKKLCFSRKLWNFSFIFKSTRRNCLKDHNVRLRRLLFWFQSKVYWETFLLLLLLLFCQYDWKEHSIKTHNVQFRKTLMQRRTNSSPSSKPGAYITHNATQPPTVWLEIQVCCASSLQPLTCSRDVNRLLCVESVEFLFEDACKPDWAQTVRVNIRVPG